jgi:uncharacterized protein (DUF1499 family)
MNRGLLFILIITVMMVSCSGNRPKNPGVTDGKLAPCPRSPNCVSTQSDDEQHYIAPIIYDGKLDRARDKLIAVIQSMKRSHIVKSEDTYIHVEFTSAFFRFVDDAEFYLDDTAKTIHMRSASRVGKSDLGVNRKRMEKVRAQFTAMEGTKE